MEPLRIVDVDGLLCAQNKRHDRLQWWCHPRHMSRRIKRLIYRHPDGVEAGLADYAIWCMVVSEVTERLPRDQLVNRDGEPVPLLDLEEEWRLPRGRVEAAISRFCDPEIGLMSGFSPQLEARSRQSRGKVEAEERRREERRVEEKRERASRKTAPRPPSLEAVQVAEHLRDAILEAAPDNATASKPGVVDRWAKDIDLSIRRDGRKPEELHGAIDWIHRHPDGSFWIPNIQSGKKLREKFDTLKAQAAAKGSATANGSAQAAVRHFLEGLI